MSTIKLTQKKAIAKRFDNDLDHAQVKDLPCLYGDIEQLRTLRETLLAEYRLSDLSYQTPKGGAIERIDRQIRDTLAVIADLEMETVLNDNYLAAPSQLRSVKTEIQKVVNGYVAKQVFRT